MSWYINRRSSPPGDWWVLEPDTKMEVRAASFELLRDKVIQVRELNGYARPEDPTQFVTDLLCERMPPGYCKDTDPPPESKGVDPGLMRYRQYKGESFAGQPTIKDVRKGFETFYRWMRGGKPLVSMTEANRRGAICAQCIKNKPHRPCPSCSAMYAAVRRLTTGRQTQHYAKLEICMVCKCCNKTQTQIPLTFLRRQPEHHYPAHCWKRMAEVENEPLTPPRTRE